MKISTILFSFISIVFSHQLYGQTTSPTFGMVTKDDLSQSFFPKDSSANAVVIYDFCQSSFDFGLPTPHIIYERKVRIKIYKKSGLNYSNVIIPFRIESDDQGSEIVKNIKGRTYNLENGSIVTKDLDPSAVYEENTIDKTHKMKFSLPQVKEGSILEYSYTIDSGLWYFLRRWTFQKEIPVLWSEYNASIPRYFDFKITLLGYKELDEHKIEETQEFGLPHLSDGQGSIKDTFVHHHFIMKNVPAIQKDDYMTTIEDYRCSIDFELARTNFPDRLPKNYSMTYQDISKTLLDLDNFGKALKRFSSTAQQIANQIKSQNKTDTLSLVNASLKYVQENLKWNEEEKLLASEKLDNVYLKRVGNSADINLILIAILRELGIEANPVVLSTRTNGKVLKDFALLDRFNYTLTHILLENKDILLDGTNKHLKVGMIPRNCLNESGWLVHSKNSRWVVLLPTEKWRTSTQLDIKLEANQKISGVFTENFYGYAALDTWNKLLKKGQKEYIDEYKMSFSFFENLNLEIKSSEQNEPIIEGKGIANDTYSMLDNRIYFMPLLWKSMQLNRFKAETRTYPVDFGQLITETIVSKIKIPSGYEVESLPQTVNIGLLGSKGRFFFQSTLKGDVIETMSQLALTRIMFSSEEYIQLREFYNKVIEKHAEKVVLKTK
ncbi:MAG: DUF3857 domain-containing protein [Spirosomataceae bacterium]